MTKNSALQEMGVNNPDEITHYSLRQEGHGDVLKIYYRRQKGSFLPSSRKYKFGRSAKTIMLDSGKQEFEETYEISPFLLKAIAELDKIVSHKESASDRKKMILNEMKHLEKTVTLKLNELREQIEKM